MSLTVIVLGSVALIVSGLAVITVASLRYAQKLEGVSEDEHLLEEARKLDEESRKAFAKGYASDGTRIARRADELRKQAQ